MSRNDGSGDLVMDPEVTPMAAVEQSVTAASINEARRLFKDATNRLLSIGEWNRWCNGLSAMFKLADQSGRILNRKARPHDVFKIGDESSLEVSRVLTSKKASGKAESIAIEVRDSEACKELFEIKRYNNVVTAIVREPAFISPLEWSRILSFILWIR